MFHSARLKLTAWYLLIIMLISIMFSVVIYTMVSKEIERFERIQRFRIERRMQGDYSLFIPNDSFQRPPVQRILTNPELLEETKHRIIFILFSVNIAILVLSGIFGYILAGRTLAPIQQMVNEQNRFISDASHELRTPLTSLKTAMEVALRDKNLSIHSAKQLITESIEEVNRLQSLSEGLLKLTQYQTLDNGLKLEKLKLSNVLKESIRKIMPLAKQKNITIHNKARDIAIKGNLYGLIDFFVILLDNAVKYSETHTTISIISQKTDGSVLVSIKDQGIGINKKDLPRIFDRFYRADAARTKMSVGGYGLGLSIAKKIIDAHHGTIDVESTPKKGSIFTVRLPIT